ncbi:response regulator transcription factor [Paenibacillus sp. PR3]|uniref:Response regulator transcription factor n=1 Tax=Paenibacillus terricola TaxID=2763503 RepID=A0ABR8N1Y6_9BACL|nr:response regulator transcription factor [Paenibacillus terricola]MBD3922197.1 response regulator transcription factor [Paenibacillus terricola]
MVKKIILVVYKKYFWKSCLKLFLEKQSNYQIVSEVDFKDMVSSVDEEDANLIIIDEFIFDNFGLNVLNILKKTNLPVLVFKCSNFFEEKDRLYLNEVNGFITPFCTEEQLLDAISEVSCNKKWLSPELSANILDIISKKNINNSSIHLTQRELEVLTLMVQGLNNTEIAKILNNSVYTVQNHISNLYSKIGLNERLKVINFAIQNGLVSQK